MIIFLYGSDTFRSRQKLNEIVDHYKKIHKSGLNLEFSEGKDLNFEEFWEKFSQCSLFNKKKLFILNNISSNQAFLEFFLKKLKKIADSADGVIIYENYENKEREPKDKLFLLKKYSKFQEFRPLTGIQLINWIKKEFEKEKIAISDEGIKLLIDFVGNDLWRMKNEIKKLSDYKRKEKEIAPSDIKKLVQPKIETAIFKTMDAISLGNKKEALKLIERHLKKGDNPLYLLSMITRQFRNLLLLKSDSNFASELHPYEAKKNFYQTQRFRLEDLKKIYQKIFELDFEIKTGKVTAEKGLENLILELPV